MTVALDIRRLTYADLPQVIAIERRAFPTPWSLAMFVLELSKPSGICLAARFVQPSAIVGLLADERDLLFQDSVGNTKVTVNNAKNVRDRLETLDPTEHLPRRDGRARFDFPAVVHHFAQHPRGKFGNAHAPKPGRLLRQPCLITRLH